MSILLVNTNKLFIFTLNNLKIIIIVTLSDNLRLSSGGKRLENVTSLNNASSKCISFAQCDSSSIYISKRVQAKQIQYTLNIKTCLKEIKETKLIWIFR